MSGAQVVELVDTPALGAGAARRESSSLSLGTTIPKTFKIVRLLDMLEYRCIPNDLLL